MKMTVVASLLLAVVTCSAVVTTTVKGDRGLPFTESPFDSDDHLEKGVDEVFGNCVREGYDAQITQDQKCQKIDLCHLGWTEVRQKR